MIRVGIKQPCHDSLKLDPQLVTNDDNDDHNNDYKVTNDDNDDHNNDYKVGRWSQR